MISFLNRHKKVIFGFTVVIFVTGVFFGLGAYVFSWGDTSSVAVVGKSKIPYETFRNQVNRVMKNMREQGAQEEVSSIMEKTVSREVLREMVMEEILAQEAAKLKLFVSDFEVAAEIQSTPQFYADKNFHPGLYVKTIWENFKMTPSQYEEWRRKARMGNKLKQFIYSAVKSTPDEVKEFYLENKGKPSDFEKKKSEYEQKLRQKNFMDAANYMLRQIAMKTEIKSYLEQIEKRAGGEA